ncbi:class III lanthionine synthetase LanKC [Spirillospora sp. NPDC048911]|uniref:class III lanthionine synthetase LanKC n=1 Tax=Spirillospora sp. NPDC048911 TaxID=3364527 RepID=UPI003715694E
MLAQTFLMVDPVFVDLLANVDDAADRFPVATRPLPHGWQRSLDGGWVYLRPPGVRLPEQGWKVHVSVARDEAEETVETVADYCLRHRVAAKFLRSDRIVHIVNGKQAARTSSGKLITLYPVDDAQLRQVLDDLSIALADRRGPRVLSDLRWGESPLYLRYGGFQEHYCLSPEGEHVLAIRDPDGRLVQDRRGPVFRVPSWVRVPDFVAAGKTSADTTGFPYRVEKALHFSNGGGIYRAVDRASGETVVLREARPHAGLDEEGADAVARLGRERAMLERAAGLGIAPRVLGGGVWAEHHFLATEFIDGERLADAVAARNPLLRAGADPERRAAYTSWALGVLDGVAAALAKLHGRGVVFGDLQPGNILLRPGGDVVLVDFETAFDMAEDHRPGLATPGFAASWARTGIAIDQYALNCLRLSMFVPLTPLMGLSPGKAGELIDLAAESFPLPPGFADRLRHRLKRPSSTTGGRRPSSAAATGCDRPGDASGLGDASWLGALRDAIVCAATPERRDRLFPGDFRQFDRQGTTLAFGAAGVLHALHATGLSDHAEFPEHVAWLIRESARLRWPRPGLYDGLAGVACVLDDLGYGRDARDLLDRVLTLPAGGPGLFGGLSGVGLALLRFGETGRAAEIADRLLALPAAGVRPGLMHGWSGAALLFVRLFETTGAPDHLTAAETLLARDDDSPMAGLDLESGTAGRALALHEYLAHRDHPRFARARDRLLGDLEVELTPAAGLLNGRAGLLACATRLNGDPRILDLHLRRFAVHEAPYHGHRAFAGAVPQRLSMDLGTGTAGVLLAAHAAIEGVPCPLPLIGGRPG